MLIISENSRVKHAILYIRLKMKGIHCSKYKLKDSQYDISKSAKMRRVFSGKPTVRKLD